MKAKTNVKAGARFPGWDPNMDAQEDAQRQSSDQHLS